MSKKVSIETVGFPTLLFLLFLGLKLANVGIVATWSWWWVTSPLWISAALSLAFIGIAIIIMIIAAICGCC